MRPVFDSRPSLVRSIEVTCKAHRGSVEQALTFPPADEARRIRWYLRKIPREELPLRVRVTPGERDAILAELTETERARVRLLTAWTCV